MAKIGDNLIFAAAISDDPKAKFALLRKPGHGWDTATRAAATRDWKGTAADSGPDPGERAKEGREGAAFFDPIKTEKGWGCNDRNCDGYCYAAEVVQSNPLDGSTDNSSIQLMFHVLVSPVL